MKKIFYFYILIFFTTYNNVLSYVPLVNNSPLNKYGGNNSDLQGLIIGIFNWGVSIAGLLSITYIIIGGFQMMTTDSIFNREEGKKKITSAIIGLLIALSGWLILNEINPDILKAKNLKPPSISVDTSAGDGGKIPDYVSTNPNNYMPNSGRYSGKNEDVMNLSKSGIRYDNEELNQYALQKIRESDLMNLKPADGTMYFKNPNNPTEEDWLNLMAAISKKESNFNSNLTYTEGFKNGAGENVVSTGLHQLSYESARGYGFRGITTEDLKDPKKNIDVAVKIMEKWVKEDGYISYKSDNGGNYGGGARYWSVLRE